jgi:hypothetical protein
VKKLERGMLSLGNESQANETAFLSKLTPVEQVRSYLDASSSDRISARTAGRTLQFRLERLKGKTKLLNKVELSDQVLNLIEN